MFVRVYAADQVVNDKGEVAYVTPTPETNRLQSPASWLTVQLPDNAQSSGNVPFIELPSGNRVQVDFSVRVPEGAIPGDHQSILFFEMFTPDEDVAAGSTRVNARVGARIQTRVEGQVIEDVKAEPFYVPGFVIGSSIPYTVALVNDGNVDQRVDTRIAILDKGDSETDITEVTAAQPLYAGTRLERTGAVEAGGGIGPTRLRLTVSYASQAPDAAGLTMTVEKERTVWVVPLWLAIALIVVLGFGALYISWRVGNRSARRKQERAKRARTRGERATTDDDEAAPVGEDL